MREIKFRGKYKYSEENIGWIYGLPVKDSDGDVYIFPDGGTHCTQGDWWFDDKRYGLPCVDPETVGQFTGLRDKNGKEIYEGDIVKRHCNAYGLDNIGVVKYDDEKARFILYCKERHYAKSLPFMKQQTINDGQCTIEETFTYETIGNIHDNPKFKED